MKHFLKIFLILCLTLIPNLCASALEDYTDELREETQENEIVLEAEDSLIEPEETEAVMDNSELDFEIFKKFDEVKESSEEGLFSRVLHSKIERTDVPSFLLQDELTYDFKEGWLSKLHPYAAYRGSINSLWKNGDTSTNYDNLTTQIGAYGSFRNPDYKFKVAFNPIPVSGMSFADRFISDAYLINTSLPNHQIVAGYSRVQTGVEGGTSTYVLPFVTRSQIARNFGSARSYAVKLIGNYQYLDYNLAVGSAGHRVTAGLPGAEFNGWVNVKPFGDKSVKYGKLTLGGGFNGGHFHNNYSVLSGYVGYKYKKLWTNFEVAIANGYNGSKGISSDKACGYAATLGWKFNPHLQLIGRIDQFDPNRSSSGDLKREYTVGLNWFIKGQALKLILNYVFCDNQNLPNSHKLIVATQVLM